jgi:alanyl-tRNA synthetase
MNQEPFNFSAHLDKQVIDLIAVVTVMEVTAKKTKEAETKEACQFVSEHVRSVLKNLADWGVNAKEDIDRFLKEPDSQNLD